MDIKVATEKTRELIDDCWGLDEAGFINDGEEIDPTSKAHLHKMCRQIMDEEVTGEKAHRWLGWIQACVCFGQGATLKDLKIINFKA